MVRVSWWCDVCDACPLRDRGVSSGVFMDTMAGSSAIGNGPGSAMAWRERDTILSQLLEAQW